MWVDINIYVFSHNQYYRIMSLWHAMNKISVVRYAAAGAIA